MEIIGFILGILIGVSLGLIGSGGSILTIPILVYMMCIAPCQATTYSLFIVGIAALVGSIKGVKSKDLDIKMALYFGVPSIISIFIMRKFLMPMLPQSLFHILGYTITKDFTTMLVFAVLMIGASFSMILKNHIPNIHLKEIDKSSIVVKGIFVGLLTGFVGVGGGFLIIPILIFYGRLSMQKAVATSLIIIAANSLIGFVGSVNEDPIKWIFLLKFTAFAVLGIFAGIYLGKRTRHEKLKPAFGWFVLITGIYIIIKEVYHQF
jgi:uncharacterized membrane protein YfcA